MNIDEKLYMHLKCRYFYREGKLYETFKNLEKYFPYFDSFKLSENDSYEMIRYHFFANHNENDIKNNIKLCSIFKFIRY